MSNHTTLVKGGVQPSRPIQLPSYKFIQNIQEFYAGFKSPYHAMYGASLVLLIVYSAQVPKEYRVFADSMLGRVLAIVGIYCITQTLGWVYGILTAVAFLLILQTSPRQTMEGFRDAVQKQTVDNKWFVEKVMNENPHTIETDRVETYPIMSN
jgi:hypothetical protein